MGNFKRLLKLKQLNEILAKAVDAVEALNQAKTSDLLMEAMNFWCEIDGNSFKDDTCKELYDLEDNLDSYFPVDEDDESSMTLVTNAINRIISFINDQIYALRKSNSSYYDEEDIVLSSTTGMLRMRLSEDFEGYEDADQAIVKEWKRTQATEKRFYTYNYNENPILDALSQTFFDNRRTNLKPTQINSTGLSARTLITADAGAVGRGLEGVDLSVLTTRTEIAVNLGWRRKEGTETNWNRESVLRRGPGLFDQSVVVNYQFQPAPGNLGNLVVNGVGRYGRDFTNKRPNILEVIDTLTNEEPELEQALAHLMISYSAKGELITETILVERGFYFFKDPKKRQQQVPQLNKLCYLVFEKEIARRMHSGMKNTRRGMEAAPELPFGTAIAKALRLIVDGHLSMADVFDRDAPYGVFSGEQLLSERNLAATEGKFDDVFKRYNTVYGRALEEEFQMYYPEGKVIATRERHHQDLLTVSGGKEDSDGEEYESSDEETQTLYAKGYW